MADTVATDMGILTPVTPAMDMVTETTEVMEATMDTTERSAKFSMF